ncbi:MAG: hypothetical protein BJ554DRAFT_505, partial [Olpidium bornovanus]
MYILEEAAPSLVITKSTLDVNKVGDAEECLGRSSYPAYSCITVEELHRKALKEATEVLTDDQIPQNSDNVSHIFFTSGTTGRPKGEIGAGCLCTHSALTAYCAAKNEVHGVTEKSVCLVASPATFDPSFGDFMATWCAGGTVALAPRHAMFVFLGRCLSYSRATHLLTTPSLLSTLDGTFGPADLPHLKVIALGGETMSQATVNAWADAVTLINTYGVTECCVYQMATVVAKGDDRRKMLGAPFRGTSICVMKGSNDEDLLTGNAADMKEIDASSGESGELWIAGVQVGLGYLNRTELTRARFVNHSSHGRCFRTGDIVRSTYGEWKLLGRFDGQVKIRGQRVELGEIEETIISIATSALLDSVVAVLHKSGLLVAFCVA